MISFSLPLTEGAASSVAPSSAFSVSAINPPAKLRRQFDRRRTGSRNAIQCRQRTCALGYEATSVWLTVPFHSAAGRKNLPGKHGQQDLIAARRNPGKTSN